MKTIKFLLLSLLFPVLLSSQELTGLWMGTLSNDSTKKTQQYELALSEYRGKVTGYSYTTFISNDTFYYSVKRLKAKRQDSVWYVEDDYMVSNNFPERAAKGVRQINTFRLNSKDSTWHLDGTWKTTQTKKYYSLTGTLQMRVEDNLSKSSLVSHLEELNLQNTVTFYQPAKKLVPVKELPIAVAKTKLKESANKPVDDDLVSKQAVAKNSQKDLHQQDQVIAASLDNTPIKNKEKPVQKNSEPAVIKTQQNKTEEPVRHVSKTEKKITEPVKEINKPAVPVKEQTASVKKIPVVEEHQKPRPEIVVSNPNNSTTKIEKKIEQPIVNVPVKEPPISVAQDKQKKETNNSVIALPGVVADRRNETIQQIYFTSDSLLLSLYDNGIVDGDTVSVFLNGENIVSKQKLKEAATKKTIYISPSTDSMQLVLFADNLGSIPPNTGLLVIRDGNETYQVRFSADMQKNAAIVFKRKNP